MLPLPSGNKIFQVSYIVDQLHVDMKAVTCIYMKWDLTGVPYCHVIACATWLKQDSEGSPHAYFKQGRYMKTYVGAILPCVSEKIGLRKSCHLNILSLKLVQGDQERTERGILIKIQKTKKAN